MARNDQNDSATTEPVNAPRRLGKYELIARIGEGGMAEVFLARQTGPLGFQKVVVVKTIHPHLAREQEFIDMLLDEARVSALIKHPRVVDIYDLGVEDGTYFIAMEYIAGQPLSRVLGVAAKHKKKLDIYSTAQIIADAADGLHAAHNLESISGEKLELVHRDVSPGNLMIQYSGNIKLLDFGVSKSMGRISTTSSGQLKGKLGYASPEQLDERPLDRRSDVWALGVVLWESLAFRRLYRQASPAATIKKILEGDTAPPSKHRPEIPSELDDICMKAMSLKPEDRFQSAMEMRKTILGFLRSANYYGERERISTFMRLLFADRKREEETLLKKVARAQSEIPVAIPVSEELASESSSSAPSAPIKAPQSKAVPDIEVVVGVQRGEEEIAADDGEEAKEARADDEADAEVEVVVVDADADASDEGEDEDEDEGEGEGEAKPARKAAPGVVPENTAEIEIGRRRRPPGWQLAAAAAGIVIVLVIAASFLGDDDGKSETDDQPVAHNDTQLDAAPAPATIDATVEPTAELDAAIKNTVDPSPAADAGVAARSFDAAPAAAPAIDAGARVEPPDAAPLSRSEALRRAKHLYDEGTKAFVSGNLGRAKARFKSALELTDYPPAYRGLGLVYERQGRKRNALYHFRKYVRSAGDASDVGAIKKRIQRLEQNQ